MRTGMKSLATIPRRNGVEQVEKRSFGWKRRSMSHQRHTRRETVQRNKDKAPKMAKGETLEIVSMMAFKPMPPNARYPNPMVADTPSSMDRHGIFIVVSLIMVRPLTILCVKS